MTEKNIFHRVPIKMTGTKLYPLTQLKGPHPALAEEELKKYQGRELLLKVKIPLLNCEWPDVLHLSPVNPVILYRQLKQAGFKLAPSKWYVIPSTHLDPKKAVWFENEKRGQGKYDFLGEDFSWFDEKKFFTEATVRERQLEYLKACKENGERPLVFNWLPHILYNDSLDVSGLNQLSWHL